MPSFKLIIPGVFKVPLSILSGRKSGWIIDSELLPVPPSFKEDISMLSEIYNPPVPCNPKSDLWPGKANKFIFIFFTFICE